MKKLIAIIIIILLGYICLSMEKIDGSSMFIPFEPQNATTSLVEPQNSLPEVVYVSKTARVSCYVDEGLTASGEYVRHGIVAVSDRSIPMDSQLYLEGFGIMDIRDKTAKWIHEKYPVMTIDIWMTAEDCKEFGLKYLTYKLI